MGSPGVIRSPNEPVTDTVTITFSFSRKAAFIVVSLP
jgi:hypothetical protein